MGVSLSVGRDELKLVPSLRGLGVFARCVIERFLPRRDLIGSVIVTRAVGVHQAATAVEIVDRDRFGCRRHYRVPLQESPCVRVKPAEKVRRADVARVSLGRVNLEGGRVRHPRRDH